METLSNLQQKLSGAEDLKSVVRSMKALAASNIGQYEMAVSALGEYNRTIGLGIFAYFRAKQASVEQSKAIAQKKRESLHCAVVLGSDQGLVGQFNDTLADFVAAYPEGIETISHLLQQMHTLQEEVTRLKNTLHFHEGTQ